MALHPHTPVVVGVGQVTIHPDPRTDPAERPEPLELMVRALRAAAEDATGAAPGGPAAAGHALIRRADSIRVVVPLGWRSVNPALLVAAKLGFDADSMPPELVLTAVGGNAPQALLHDACRAISRGDLGVVLVTGAEALYTRAAARRDPSKAGRELVQPAGRGDAPAHLVRDGAARGDRPGDLPRDHPADPGLPALRERVARRQRLDTGRAPGAHRLVVVPFQPGGRIQPLRLDPPRLSPRGDHEPSPDNRMISFPYPKLCTANMQVDQGAAYIVCSVEAARAAGVPEERWVFPLAGADAHDHWFISHRPELHRSPAIRLAAGAAFELAGVGPDDLGPIDLYSCFPAWCRWPPGRSASPSTTPTGR